MIDDLRDSCGKADQPERRKGSTAIWQTTIPGTRRTTLLEQLPLWSNCRCLPLIREGVVVAFAEPSGDRTSILPMLRVFWLDPGVAFHLARPLQEAE